MRNQLTKTGYKGIHWTRDKEGEKVLRVRTQARDPKTGLPKDMTGTIKRPAGMDDQSYLAYAVQARDELRTDCGPTAPGLENKRFGEYVEEQILSKIKRGIINSPATKQKYRDVLDAHVLPKWGKLYLDKITRKDCKAWLEELGELVKKTKQYKPHTVNDWWSLFKSTMAEAAEDFDLGDPTSGLEAISLTLHRTYTKRQPNALKPEEVSAFFDAAFKVAPDHYAILVLGTLTGRRPCELFTLRHGGRDPDLDWESGELEIRRSITVPDIDWETGHKAAAAVPQDRTKTKKDLCAYLPRAMLDILLSHVNALRGKQRDSELLFPPKWLRNTVTEDGYQSRWNLRRPLQRICEKAEITKRITPRAMRRTYQDLCRAAQVSQLVQMSMSGHATTEMMEHYSTVAETEGRAALTRMCSVAGLA